MAGTQAPKRERNLREQLGVPDRKTKAEIATEDIKVTIEREEKTEPLPLAVYEKGTARG